MNINEPRTKQCRPLSMIFHQPFIALHVVGELHDLILVFLRMLEICCCSTYNNDNDNNNDYNNKKLWNFVSGNVGWWFLCQCPYQSSSHNPGKEKIIVQEVSNNFLNSLHFILGVIKSIILLWSDFVFSLLLISLEMMFLRG